MGISKLLLNSQIERLQLDYNELLQELALHPTVEANEFKEIVEKKLSSLGKLENKLSREVLGSVDLELLNLTFRDLKLQFRFTQRKWKRTLVNESRLTKRMQKRSSNAATIAA